MAGFIELDFIELDFAFGFAAFLAAGFAVAIASATRSAVFFIVWADFLAGLAAVVFFDLAVFIELCLAIDVDVDLA